MWEVLGYENTGFRHKPDVSMSKTASYVKDKYNAKTYDRYTFYMRKDEHLNVRLQADKQKRAISQTVKDALFLYYSVDTNQTEPGGSTRPKSNKTSDYTTKRQRRTAMKTIISQLEMIKAAEERSRDNVPDNLHNSPAFEVAEECISALDEALEILRSAY